MLPIIISSGQGLDSEDLSLFNDEEIGGLKLTERILLIVDLKKKKITLLKKRKKINFLFHFYLQ